MVLPESGGLQQCSPTAPWPVRIWPYLICQCEGLVCMGIVWRMREISLWSVIFSFVQYSYFKYLYIKMRLCKEVPFAGLNYKDLYLKYLYLPTPSPKILKFYLRSIRRFWRLYLEHRWRSNSRFFTTGTESFFGVGQMLELPWVMGNIICTIVF